jgi:hypothetical protein
MTLKIGPVTDRAPTRLAVMLHPDAHDALADYARIHAREFGREIPLGDLAALMIERFLQSDTAFKRARKSIGKSEAAKE